MHVLTSCSMMQPMMRCTTGTDLHTSQGCIVQQACLVPCKFSSAYVAGFPVLHVVAACVTCMPTLPRMSPR